MLRHPSLITCLLFFSLSVNAQQGRREDVLHLADKWVIRGAIISHTDSTIRIRTRDGNIFAFPVRQVESITQETPWSVQMQTARRWMSYTELGPLIAGKTNQNGVTTAAFSFQTLVGYSLRARCRVQPFIGVGADLYAIQTVLPLFGSLRADLVRRENYSLYTFIDAGYGLDITRHTEDRTVYKGGLLYAGGLGIRIPFNERAGFLLSLAYRYQKTTITSDGYPDDVIYRRLALRAGFYL